MAIEVVAQTRKQQGTGASRRLRLTGKVPASSTGARSRSHHRDRSQRAVPPVARREVSRVHSDAEARRNARAGAPARVNMHPWKRQVQHIDFQRVSADEKIHMKVPLHFVNAEISPAVKDSAGIVSHVMNELDIRCLPRTCRSTWRSTSRGSPSGTRSTCATSSFQGRRACAEGTENPPVARRRSRR